MTNTAAPHPRTKKLTTTPTIAPAPDIAAIEAEATAMDAELAAQETALRQNLQDLAERRQNAQKAKALLEQTTTRQRREEAAEAAQNAHAEAQHAYEADLEARRRLFARAQELTTELAGVVRDALAIDSRIYAAALQLGIGTQRGGYAKRAITDFIGRRLSMVGLSDMPRGRLDRNLVNDPQPSDGGH